MTTLEEIKVALGGRVQELSEANGALADVPPLDITIENFETLRAMFNYVAARIESS